MEIIINKTVAEAIEEIESKLYNGRPLTTDTMLLALAALIEYDKQN